MLKNNTFAYIQLLVKLNLITEEQSKAYKKPIR
ncbi:hypothetical protein JOC54_004070 [Alkalihalobacillus xiaoxiensis]|uniref:Uncharacterized protein n=1 Tax=Shouchella xiaoxiensis TaxID=766895 RepID=A0ABS2T2S8_9BACI|nr:hypothetical protein [Shouchella xiaoxiensis]